MHFISDKNKYKQKAKSDRKKMKLNLFKWNQKMNKKSATKYAHELIKIYLK